MAGNFGALLVLFGVVAVAVLIEEMGSRKAALIFLIAVVMIAVFLEFSGTQPLTRTPTL